MSINFSRTAYLCTYSYSVCICYKRLLHLLVFLKLIPTPKCYYLIFLLNNKKTPTLLICFSAASTKSIFNHGNLSYNVFYRLRKTGENVTNVTASRSLFKQIMASSELQDVCFFLMGLFSWICLHSNVDFITITRTQYLSLEKLNTLSTELRSSDRHKLAPWV